MNEKQLNEYLQRIGLDQRPPCTVAGLAAIQHAHLENVPFECLDIFSAPIILKTDEASLFDKIVTRRRGGICYEVGYLYASALRALGFSVRIMGARVYDYGTDYDHVFLMVDDPEDPCGLPLITDVGFARNFARPLRFEPYALQNDGFDDYFIRVEVEDADTRYRILKVTDDGEENVFSFRNVTRTPRSFIARCNYYSTNDESRFRRGALVSIDSSSGRKTLSTHHFIEMRDGVREEREIEYPGEFNELLASVFKLELEI